MRSLIAARIGRLEEQRRPAPLLRSKEQRDASVRAVLSDPARTEALSAGLETDAARFPTAHVIAAALRADA